MAQPARAYDALYDTNYTVSGARDHYRQQTMAGGFNIERAPLYNNFFSELSHYPATTLKLKNNDRVPGFVDRTFHEPQHDAATMTLKSDPLLVTGPNRPKYFRRPLLAGAEIPIKQALAPSLGQRPASATLPPLPEPASKTIGTQSDFRENEAQTTAWEPGYVLPVQPTAKQAALSRKYNADGPEVLALKDMTFAEGLPAGLQEITRIDKMRAKRAFEATLPPLDDVARLPLRQKMIEEWEAKEWEEREYEILSVQEERLALLETALQVREEEIDAEATYRIEARKAEMMDTKAAKFATIQSNRIKTMRQLIENRKYVEQHRKLHKPTIVEKYANFGSTTYAPLQRDGRFPESKPLGKDVETEGYAPATLQGVMELESFLPARLLNPKIQAPKRKPAKLTYNQRQEAAVQNDLKSVNDLLDTAKQTMGRGYGDCWPAPLSSKDHPDSALGGGTGRANSAGGGARNASVTAAGAMAATAGSLPQQQRKPAASSRVVDRPRTPELPPPPAMSARREAAIILLQRLLRGRAAQNIMYEGRVRRQELITELRLGEKHIAAAAPQRRPEERDAAMRKVDSLIGTAVSEILAVLSETDPDKRAMLLASLDMSQAHATAAAVAAASVGVRQEAQQNTVEKAVAAAAEAAAAAGAAGDVTSAASAAEAAYAEVVEAAEASSAVAALNLSVLGISAEEAEAAAVRIQAAARGRRARKEVVDMRAKGEMLRRFMNAEAQTKLVACQAAARGYLARKRVKSMREDMARSRAVRAEDAPAAAGADAAEDEAEAATPSTGSAAAAAAGRSAFDGLEYSDDQRAAAARIQAVQRGRVARQHVSQLKQAKAAATTVQPTAAAAAADDEHPGSAAEAVEDCEASQQAAGSPAEGEADDLPQYSADHEAAIVRIQAAHRGWKARKDVAGMRGQQPGASTSGAAGATFSPEHAAAATRIQAAARGRAARKQVAELRTQRHQEQPALPLPADEASSSGFKPEHEAAATRIQAAARGRAARKQVAALRGQAGPLAAAAEPSSSDGAALPASSGQPATAELSVAPADAEVDAATEDDARADDAEKAGEDAPATIEQEGGEAMAEDEEASSA